MKRSRIFRIITKIRSVWKKIRGTEELIAMIDLEIDLRRLEKVTKEVYVKENCQKMIKRIGYWRNALNE